ncbi:hypothetical protein PVL29_020805 [Vitis rotundifolia]|uniref:Reverse transcriptase zinc-binding domain-containing protein n=1 Tax=Vitis rotundifolia TaxID=103349 RepID=A0AA39DCH9_VITRO|nr:hypothetical protein PVL29_020805 [Vitis rotundifolia]
MWFEAVSGLRINLEKSELIPVGRVENIDDLALDFGCRVGSLSSTYLGLPLGAPFKLVSVWDGVEERFCKRLTMWKRQYLSKGGRATLIRSTLSNLPIYFMSLLRLPSLVRRRLEQIQRDFLWGGGNLERKPHLVRWEMVCLSKKKGGLGVKCLSILNKALLSKWNWRYANEKEALWNQVIRGKYGENRGGWCSREVREVHGVGLWKGIRMDWELVDTQISFSVGNGRRVSFWRDRWCGDSPLCETFPSLFALAVEKEAWVAEVWDPLAEGGWGGLEPLCIWNGWVQPKISFFAWEAAWGKTLTLDLVQKRGWSLANRCFMCLENEETIDHLLLHCSKTRTLWELLFTLVGVSWVMPSSVRETLLSWHDSFVGKKRRKVWKTAPLHIFWTVWKARNRLTFKDNELSIQRLKYSFILSLWPEAKLFIVECSQSLVNFIDWLGSF